MFALDGVRKSQAYQSKAKVELDEYDYYLRGHEMFYRYTAEDNARARQRPKEGYFPVPAGSHALWPSRIRLASTVDWSSSSTHALDKGRSAEIFARMTRATAICQRSRTQKLL